jgi:pyruvate/2-oxoglutarate dehydrogenase complex dihydrolipoamide acyltransferase (E2) component
VSAPAWAELVTQSATQVPQAASVVEIDLSRVAERMDRDRAAWAARGIEPGWTAYLAEALLAALRKAPQANASFESNGIRRYPAVHLGLSLLAADGSAARHGVVRDADTRNALGLAFEVHAVQQAGSADQSGLAQATVSLADYGPDSALFAVPLVLPGQSLAVRVGAVEERLITRDTRARCWAN